MMQIPLNRTSVFVFEMGNILGEYMRTDIKVKGNEPENTYDYEGTFDEDMFEVVTTRHFCTIQDDSLTLQSWIEQKPYILRPISQTDKYDLSLQNITCRNKIHVYFLTYGLGRQTDKIVSCFQPKDYEMELTLNDVLEEDADLFKNQPTNVFQKTVPSSSFIVKNLSEFQVEEMETQRSSKGENYWKWGLDLYIAITPLY